MHYFWGLSRHFAQDDAAMTSDIHDAIIRTFEEDAGVLKLQHELIKSDAPEARGNNIDADRGITLAHRLVDELMRGERAATT
jgi:vanillate monooxygenase